MFLDLLPEIQQKIICYCCINDLTNLSRTSSKCNQLLKKFLFHTVQIPPSHLQKKYFVNNKKLKKRLENLVDTKCLLISAPFIPQCTFKAISKLVNLVELNLHGSKSVDNCNFSMVCEGLAGLKVLDIAFTKITDKGLLHIQKLVTLEELVLICCNITDLGISYISTLSKLKKLNTRACFGITDAGLSYMSSLYLLEDLCLNRCQITDLGLSRIATLANMKKLDVTYCRDITDMGIVYIRNFVFLEDLCLSFCEITDEGISCISTLRNLQNLDVSYCEHITDVSLSYIVSLTELKKLNVHCCFGITDLGISGIRNLVTWEICYDGDF